MKLGDLSNKPAPSLAIRFERVIKTDEGKLNRAARAYLYNLWRELDINIHILTTGNARKVAAFCFKWSVPYAKVFEVTTLEIPLLCLEHEYAFYYDVDRDVLQNVEARASHVTKAQFFERIEVADGPTKRVSNNPSRLREIQ